MATVTEKVFSFDELQKNHDLVSIDGGVFDLTRLAPNHPGGSIILASGGMDCTAFFHSVHVLNTERNLKTLQLYRVGRLEGGPVFPFEFDTPFATDLKQSVIQIMGHDAAKWYAPWQFYARAILIVCATMVSEFFWIVHGSIVAMVATGSLHAFAVFCFMHDGSHGAVSSRPWINSLFHNYIEWTGAGRWWWYKNHVMLHHPYANIESYDPDCHLGEPALQLCAEPTTSKTWVHRFQWLYGLPLIATVLGMLVTTNFVEVVSPEVGDWQSGRKFLTTQRPTQLALRLFYFVRCCVLPHYFAGVPVFFGLGVPVVAGALVTFPLMSTHNTVETKGQQHAESKNAMDWYKHQISTATNFGDFSSMLWSGGINYQIEHHLFPRLNSWHYPRISEAVKQVCARHGVTYTHFPSLGANLISMFRYLALNGRATCSANNLAVGDLGSNKRHKMQ